MMSLILTPKDILNAAVEFKMKGDGILFFYIHGTRMDGK